MERVEKYKPLLQIQHPTGALLARPSYHDTGSERRRHDQMKRVNIAAVLKGWKGPEIQVCERKGKGRSTCAYPHAPQPEPNLFSHAHCTWPNQSCLLKVKNSKATVVPEIGKVMPWRAHKNFMPIHCEARGMAGMACRALVREVPLPVILRFLVPTKYRVGSSRITCTEGKVRC